MEGPQKHPWASLGQVRDVRCPPKSLHGIRRIKSVARIKLLLVNISRIKELHNIHVEIIIHSLKQNNVYSSYPSNMQIISQKQLNVDIFSSHGQSSLGQEQPQG